MNLPFQMPAGLPVVILLAVLAGLALALLALSFAMVARARSMVRRAEQKTEEAERRWEDLFQTCRNDLASHMQDLDRQAVEHAAQSSPRLGLNLSRRSQALRMYRNGGRPDQIAAALEVPRQEVELLIKVHQIVVDSV